MVDDIAMLQGMVSRADLLKGFLRSDDEVAVEVRRTAVSSLYPTAGHSLDVTVHEGVVTLRGHVHDTALVPIAVRLVHSVEGVVDVEPQPTGRDTA